MRGDGILIILSISVSSCWHGVTACSWMRRQGVWWVSRLSHLPSPLSTHLQVVHSCCNATFFLRLILRGYIGVYWKIIAYLLMRICLSLITFILAMSSDWFARCHCLWIVHSVLWCCWLGGRKGIRPVKTWVVRCWHGCLSGARCRLAYGPAGATATHCLLRQ